MDDLGYDSFNMMMAISDIEDLLDIAIPSKRLGAVISVKDLKEILREFNALALEEQVS
nr:hypothetical protein [Agaribacterium haliotis]